jgi:hypothetical protein
MRRLLDILSLFAATAISINAASFSFAGGFISDDQVQLFTFSIAKDSAVTIRSLAYGGGKNVSGTTVLPGGFDSFLSLFSAGSQIASNDDDTGCEVSLSRNGSCLDAYLHGDLQAGDYTLALTESGNFPADDVFSPFSMEGFGNFTCARGFCNAITQGQDSGAWALDITGVDGAAAVGRTPEPGTFWLFTLGVLVVIWRPTRQLMQSVPRYSPSGNMPSRRCR